MNLITFIVKYFNKYRLELGKPFFHYILAVLSFSFFEIFNLTLLIPALDIVAVKSINPESNFINKFVLWLFKQFNTKPTLLGLLSLMGAIFLLKGIFKYIQLIIKSNIEKDIFIIYRGRLLKSIMNVKYKYFTTYRKGDLNNIFYNEVLRVQKSFSRYVELLCTLCLFVGYLFTAFSLNFNMSFAIVFASGLIYFLFLPIVKKVTSNSVLFSKSNSSLQDHFLQFMGNFQYLKATSNFVGIKQKVDNEIKENSAIYHKGNIFAAVSSSFIEPVLFVFLAYVIFSEAKMLVGNISMIVVPLVVLNRCLNQISNIQEKWLAFQAVYGGVEKYDSTLIALEEQKETYTQNKITTFKNEIALKNISFSYGNKVILDNINISIKKNQSLGIIGKSGSGKSTLINIVTGLISPTKGEIYIDGLNYSQLNLKSLREHLGYITQNPAVFNDSIINNITLWNEKIDRNKITEATRKSHSNEFIEMKDDGIRTIIGDSGSALSGGQKQRVSIARELYFDRDILIFDEATSALDSESERFIHDSIGQIIGTKTIIIVAHRLSTVKDCDQICVLDQGKIIQFGPWEELIKDKNGYLYKTCQIQGVFNHA